MRLKELREKKRLTQKELANKSGVSITMINMIEREKTGVSIRTLEKLANALDCDIKRLL